MVVALCLKIIASLAINFFVTVLILKGWYLQYLLCYVLGFKDWCDDVKVIVQQSQTCGFEKYQKHLKLLVMSQIPTLFVDN